MVREGRGLVFYNGLHNNNVWQHYMLAMSLGAASSCGCVYVGEVSVNDLLPCIRTMNDDLKRKPDVGKMMKSYGNGLDTLITAAFSCFYFLPNLVGFDCKMTNCMIFAMRFLKQLGRRVYGWRIKEEMKSLPIHRRIGMGIWWDRMWWNV